MIFSTISFLVLACAPKKTSTVRETPAPTMAPVPVAQHPIPVVPKAPQFTPLEPATYELGNRSELWIHEDHSLPLVVLKAVLPGGYFHDPRDLSGQAWLVSKMMGESAGGKSALEVSEALRLTATQLSISVGRTETTVTLSTLKDNLTEMLPYFVSTVLTPDFREDDWQRVLKQSQNAQLQSLKDASSIASNYSSGFLYGFDHPWGRIWNGTSGSLSRQDRQRALNWHQQRLTAGQVKFIASGDVDPLELSTQLDIQFPSQKLIGTLSAAPPAPEQGAVDKIVSSTATESNSLINKNQPDSTHHFSEKIFLVDLPGAQQTSIRVMSHAWTTDPDLRVKESLAAMIIGGSFTSRLNSLLREKKGYTYGARCRFLESAIGGQFIASTSVQTKFTAPALIDLLGVLNDITFTEEELSKSKKLKRNDIISSSVGLNSIAAEMESMATMDQRPILRGLKLKVSDTVSLESLNSTTPLFNSARGVIVLIGDKEKVLAPLTKAGFSITLSELPSE